jgi:Zn-dependent protease with chaperone function
MGPDVYEMLDECVAQLAIELPVELYVYASPQFNAACVKPEEGRLFIMLSSSLLEAFKGSELRFVLGHELGHHLYNHHDIPIGYLLRGKAPPNPKLALALFAWLRYAEISADRAGAHCAKDLEGIGARFSDSRPDLEKMSSHLTSTNSSRRSRHNLAKGHQMAIGFSPIPLVPCGLRHWPCSINQN